MYKLGIGIAFGLLLFNGTAMAACSSYPYILTNGQTADATQVMADFNCAALTSGATLNNVALTGSIIFSPSGSEAARFGSDGSFLVGTTTNGGWNTNAKLEARQTGSGYALSAYNSDTGLHGGGGILVRTDSTNNPQLAYFGYGNTGVGTITTNGTSTAYNTTSDERLKDWQVPQKNYAEAIRNIWIGDFKWKKGGETDFGVRAQQAYALFPSAIRKPKSDQDYWQADYGRLAPLALWGVKDLYAITDSQKRSVSSVGNDVKALRPNSLR
jgi:hypothetical protein